MRCVRLGLLVVLSWPTVSVAQARVRYDKITDQSAVSYFWLLDIPMLGPQKQVDLLYTFPGETRAVAPDTLLLVITMKSHRTAGGFDEGGWKLQRRPTLHVLIDDSVRFAFDVVGDDAKVTSRGSLGHSLDEMVGYAVPVEVVRRLAVATNAAFSVGSWRREVKPKELAKLRRFVEGDFLK